MKRMKVLILATSILAASALLIPQTASAQCDFGEFRSAAFDGGEWGWRRGGGWPRHPNPLVSPYFGLYGYYPYGYGYYPSYGYAYGYPSPYYGYGTVYIHPGSNYGYGPYYRYGW